MTYKNAKSGKVMIAPSALAADFGYLAEEIAKVEKAGADLIHLDVMDGHFVSNITFGPGLVKAVRKTTKLPLDVHLMIENPERYIPEFAKAGANIITVHFETCNHLHRTIYSIKELGIKAGVSLNPHTPPFLIDEILNDIDLILIMSVNPGFGGQSFIEKSLTKIKAVRSMIDEAKCDCLIEVDGGINDITGQMCREAGVDILAAGSYIFGASDYNEAIQSLRE
ncbi:MAG: ribulose-phosphate 3-epimerase [candidate division Zixibacteria bacterium]|nr:ribulose-phosphate 3-epimerase [candidate division Zixibacteria bacterium]